MRLRMYSNTLAVTSVDIHEATVAHFHHLVVMKLEEHALSVDH